MFIGAICHDLDHRGFNNKFMIDIGSPLAAIYSTSTMEHPHFNMTVTILQQVGIAPRIDLVLFMLIVKMNCPYNSYFFWNFPTLVDANATLGEPQYFCKTKSRRIPRGTRKYQALYSGNRSCTFLPQ